MQSLQTKPNIISLTPKNSYKLILTSAYSSLGMDLSPKFILYRPKFFKILESQGKDTKLKVLAVLTSQCVPRYKLWRKDKKRKVTIKNDILRRG